MAQTQSILLAPVPKAVRMIGIPLAAVLLTSFFILLGFPYHHLTNRAAAMASQALGMEIQAADSGLSFGLDGPGFWFEDITIETPTGDTYPVDRARFGPAWSLSWFLLTPTYFFEIESELGHAQGRVRNSDDPAWSATVSDANLTKLEVLHTMMPIKLTGTLDADGNVETSEGIYTGPLGFAVRKGVLAHPNMPLEVPFDTLDGAIVFGGDAMLAVETLELVGPMLSFSARGTVGIAEKFTERALDLDLAFSDVKPEMRSIVETVGVKLARDGTAQLHVGGTAGKPVMK